jgi:hypothetical protein
MGELSLSEAISIQWENFTLGAKNVLKQAFEGSFLKEGLAPISRRGSNFSTTYQDFA